MGLQLIINADTPAQLAPVWRALGGAPATVEIIDNLMGIQIDLTAAVPEAPVGPAEAIVDDLVDQLAPIPIEDENDDDEIVEPTPAAVEQIVAQADADVVPIDQRSRERHPATTSGAPSCASAIVDALAAEPDVTFSITEIVDSIDGYKESTIKFTVAQLTRDGKIARAGRGLYKAAS
jgi:hypothetical protein